MAVNLTRMTVFRACAALLLTGCGGGGGGVADTLPFLGERQSSPPATEVPVYFDWSTVPCSDALPPGTAGVDPSPGYRPTTFRMTLPESLGEPVRADILELLILYEGCPRHARYLLSTGKGPLSPVPDPPLLTTEADFVFGLGVGLPSSDYAACALAPATGAPVVCGEFRYEKLNPAVPPPVTSASQTSVRPSG